MRKIIRIAVVFAAIFVFALLLPNGAAAVGIDTDGLYEGLPDEAGKLLSDSGITPENGISGITAGDVFSDVISFVKENAVKPSKMFASLLGVILLTSLMKNLSDISDGRTRHIYSLVSALTAAAVISGYAAEVISMAGAAVESAGNFMLSYVPALAGIIAVSGNAGAAAAYSSSALIGTELLAQMTKLLLIPLTGCMLGISTVSGLNDSLKLGTLSDGIKKAVTWTLGLIMTLFLGLLSVQTTLSASADSAALRTARFFVSSGIPIVGGAVSDALSTVSGSLSLLKTGIGGFGIAAGVAMLMPSMLNLLLHSFFLFIAGVIADAFGSGELSAMIKAGQNALSVSVAITACFMLFLTVSTALLLAACRG